MNDPTPSLEEPAVAPATDDTAAAPKRRRSRAAPKVAAQAEAVATSDPAVAPTDVAAAADEAPAPKRRARKTAARSATGADVTQVTEGSVQATVAADSVAAQPAVVPAVVAIDAAPAVSVVADESALAPAQAADGSQSGGESDSARPPRDRNRRRDRRDRQRERDTDGSGEGRDVAPMNVASMPAAPVADVAARFEDVISGQFDDEAGVAADVVADAVTSEEVEPAAQVDAVESVGDEAETEPGKRVLSPEPEAPKLHKVLAASGIGSRRDMEALIEEGQITVNGEVAHPGMRITWGDQVKVNGRPVKIRIAPPPARVLAYHKPVGEVVTHNDPEGRPTVFKRLPRLQQGRWLSVGRLDLNTEGLLLFTNSGDLANQLMHPRFGVEREYAVRVLGSLTTELRQQLLEGVDVEGQKASFKAIEDGGGGEGANHWWRVVITEGRNREVRKLFDAVGLTVSRLIRIRYGTVVLPRGLKRGVWVELDENDVRLIRRLAGGDARRQGSGQAGGVPQQRQGGPNAAPQGQPGNQRGPKNKQQQRGRGPGGQQQGYGNGPQQGYGNQQQPRGPRPQGGGHGGAPQGGREPYDDDREADDPLFIPNPLEQTFDRRFATGSKRISAGFGRPSDDAHQPRGQRQKGEPRQPDPMQTSVGYIGADAYFRKPGGGGGGGGGGGNKRGRRR